MGFLSLVFKVRLAGVEASKAAEPPLERSSKAWRKLTPSCHSTNWMAFPALPQHEAMQRNKPLEGVTMRFGVLVSLWNGQKPIQLAPCFSSFSPLDWIRAMRSVSLLMRSISSFGILGMGIFRFEPSRVPCYRQRRSTERKLVGLFMS